MKIKHLLISLFILVICIQFRIQAQALREIDKTPLSRPIPLAKVKSNDASALLQKIHKILEDFKFVQDYRDYDIGLIIAKRMDGLKSEDYDKVIIWLERDFEKPNELIKIYFLYGRFEEIRGREYGIQRVKLQHGEEDKRVGNLKNEIKSLQIN